MNTTTQLVPILKQTRKRDYVFLLEDLELVMHKGQLSRVTESWNDGTRLEVIAEFEKRKPIEILIALMHQTKKGCKVRAFY